MSETKKSLIDQLLEDVDAVIEKAKRPFIKKKINRSFDSAIESVEEEKLDAEITLNNLRKNLIRLPQDAAYYINEIAQKRGKIIDADKTIIVLKAEKDELFK